VMVHRPGVEMHCGLLEPEPFLYYGPFTSQKALREHELLCSTLEDAGVGVYILKDEIVRAGQRQEEFRENIKKLVSQVMRYSGNNAALVEKA